MKEYFIIKRNILQNIGKGMMIIMMTVAQAMVKCLEEERTTVVFGYPGAAIGAFYDALSHSA